MFVVTLLVYVIPLVVLWVIVWLLFRFVRATERIASAHESMARELRREVTDPARRERHPYP